MFRTNRCFNRSASASQRIRTDGCIAALHFIVTVAALVFCSIFLVSESFLNEPIACKQIRNGSFVSPAKLNNYCFAHGTYSVKEKWNKNLGKGVTIPDVDGHAHGQEERVYHHYYKWVSLLLFLQSITFYIPRFFWRRKGGRRLEAWISSGMCDDEEGYLSKLVEGFVDTFRSEYSLFHYYIITQTLYAANVFLQFLLIDVFLDGRFLSLGAEYVAYVTGFSSVDPLVEAFPVSTECTMGFSAAPVNSMTVDAVCLLGMNSWNQKIFICLWFWLMFLIVVSWAYVISILFLQSSFEYQLLMATVGNCHEVMIETVIEEGNIDDWFKITVLANNVSPRLFSKFIKSVHNHVICPLNPFGPELFFAVYNSMTQFDDKNAFL